MGMSKGSAQWDGGFKTGKGTMNRRGDQEGLPRLEGSRRDDHRAEGRPRQVELRPQGRGMFGAPGVGDAAPKSDALTFVSAPSLRREIAFFFATARAR